MAVEAFDASDMETQMSASIVLVGADLAIAVVIGVLVLTWRRARRHDETGSTASSIR